MKLLFIWVKNFKCFQESEMNFYGNPRFHYDSNKKEITLIDPEINLFPLEDYSYIENASVIVGSNGSGKSSICDLLYVGMFYHSSNCQYLFLYELNNRIFLYTNLPSNEMVFSGVKIDKDSFFNEFNILYYSPFYDPDHKRSCIKSGSALFKDLSTSNLLEEDYTEYKNERPDTDYTSIYNVDKITAHETLDNLRFLKFLCKYDKLKKGNFNLNITLPSYSLISYDKNQFDKFVAECHDKNSFIYTYYEFLKTNIENVESKQTFIEKTLLAMYCNFCTTYSLMNRKGTQDEIIDEYLMRIKKGFSLSKESVISILSNIFKELANTDNITNLEIPIDNRKAVARLDFINYIKSLDERFFKIKLEDVKFSEIHIVFNLAKDDETSYLINFMNIYNYIEGTTSFIDSNFYPFISAGEKSEIQLYARLMYGIEKLRTDATTKETLIFLDESEITLHPQLQQKLTYNVLNFLGSLYSDFKFQIIFATHSPIVLSDFPLSNVVFFEKKAGERYTHISPGIKKQTFAANIYALYNDSFFLKSLPIGDFAMKLINIAIDDVNTCYENPEKDIAQKTKDIIKMIGEPIFKSILEARL